MAPHLQGETWKTGDIVTKCTVGQIDRYFIDILDIIADLLVK